MSIEPDIRDDDLVDAAAIIKACEDSLRRRLSVGEQRDLLMDNTDWSGDHVAIIVARLNG